jgi:hypothetical protein
LIYKQEHMALTAQHAGLILRVLQVRKESSKEAMKTLGEFDPKDFVNLQFGAFGDDLAESSQIDAAAAEVLLN